MSKLPLIVLLLTGCAYMSEVISGDENSVQIKAGPYANPGPTASKHCGKYGKSAKLRSFQGGMIYEFTCH